MSRQCSRRSWLTTQSRNAAALLLVASPSRTRALGIGRAGWSRREHHHPGDTVTRLEPGPFQALAQRAVEAAQVAGAKYADARLTRVVKHQYEMFENGNFFYDSEEVGVGIRALVQGFWGFSASPVWAPDEVVRLAHEAVAQATAYANASATGTPRRVDLSPTSAITGTWTTPIAIDPFAISIEEKRDAIVYWKDSAQRAGLPFYNDGIGSDFQFARKEQILATSEGSLLTQTFYESGGRIVCYDPQLGLPSPTIAVPGLDMTGQGWELFLDAKFPDQFPVLRETLHRQLMVRTKPSTVGRYTLVCDGATMASLLDKTVGIATQLDRALGYEANASGTSFLDDPLAMVGTFSVTSPLVTVTANRSVPTQLATVQWDDEAVQPRPFTLIQDGVLVDFQTTREQAAWLAPYYNKHGSPVRSHGCAASEDAHVVPMQHMPNLALEPSQSPTQLMDLVATLTEGILIEHGEASGMDFQARNGLLSGRMRQIKNGRLGDYLSGGVIQFNTLDLWKHIMVVGGATTQGGIAVSQYGLGLEDMKGQPAQMTSHSVRAAAATITNQPLIDPARKV